MKRNIILYFLLLCSISIFAQGVVTPPRTCSVCKITKPASEFSGDSKTCKACAQKAAAKKKRKERQAEEHRRQQQLEQERIAREKAEKERIAREKAEHERLAREKAEQERLAREEAEREDREGVDLGLPSGTLWATRNVGASSPEDYGDYFAWGETKGYKSGKRDFSWSTYKWCAGDIDKQTKYCNDRRYGKKGFTDNKTELDLEDDAAYVNWGSQWRMPSLDQINELRSHCTWTWTQLNGVNGYRVTSKTNGNSIFLPAAGWCNDTSLYGAGFSGYYWSRTLGASYPYCAYHQDFGSGYVDWSNFSRHNGQSVRPVRH